MTASELAAEFGSEIRERRARGAFGPIALRALLAERGITAGRGKCARVIEYATRPPHARPEPGSKGGAPPAPTPSSTFEQSGSVATFTARMVDLQDPEKLLRDAGIDLTRWRVKEFKVTHLEAFRKRESKDIEFTQGGMRGWSKDSGDLLVRPLCNISVRLELRHDTIDALRIVGAAIDAAKAERGPSLPSVARVEPGDVLLEVSIPDLHVGLLSDVAATGDRYDLEAAEGVFRGAVETILARAQAFQPSAVLFPVGNDLLHVDSSANATRRGTPQDVSAFWDESLRRALRLMYGAIERFRALGLPVIVPVVPGNHAPTLEMAIGAALALRYDGDALVSVDDSSAPAKYHRHGCVLLGFQHGDEESMASLASTMTLDRPLDVAECAHREWHVGHLHHRKKFAQLVDEGDGVIARVLPSLAAKSRWSKRRGYKSLRGAEAYLWSASEGLVGMLHAAP